MHDPDLLKNVFLLRTHPIGKSTMWGIYWNKFVFSVIARLGKTI